MTAGRKPADPAARLALLKAAQKKLRKGDVLNAPDMAAALSMTPRNLMLTIAQDPDLPIQKRGAQGRAYEFDAAAVIAHMIAKCEAALSERQSRAARVKRLSGHQGAAATPGVPSDGDELLSVGDLRDINDLQLSVHKRKLQQGHFVVKDTVTAFMADYHAMFQDGVLGLLGKIDPAGQLPADVRLKVEDSMRTLLVNQQARMDRFLNGIRVASPA